MIKPYIYFLIISFMMIGLVSAKIYYISQEQRDISTGELSEAIILIPSFLLIIFSIFLLSIISSILHKGHNLGKKIILLVSCFMIFLNSVAIFINGIILTYGNIGVSGNKSFDWSKDPNYTTSGNLSLATGAFGFIFSLTFIIYEGLYNNNKIKI